MQLKTFVADSMPEALDRIREAMGPDAVLLRTSMVDRQGKKRVEITAATDPLPDAQAPGGANIDHQAWGFMRGELESAQRRIQDLEAGDPLVRWLAEADFLPETARRIAGETRPNTDPLAQVARVIGDLITATRTLLPPPDRPRRIALVGPPGAGKTTTLVKLAAQAASSSRTDIVLVNLDSYRPGADEYLAQVAETLRVPVLSERTRDVQRGMPEADGLVLIDTDARIWASDPGSVAVRATLQQLRPDAVALVLPAPWRARDLQDALHRYASCRPDHLIFSGLDLTIRYGGILSIACQARLPVACVTTTGRFDSGVRMFRPEALLQQMQTLQEERAARKEPARA